MRDRPGDVEPEGTGLVAFRCVGFFEREGMGLQALRSLVGRFGDVAIRVGYGGIVY